MENIHFRTKSRNNMNFSVYISLKFSLVNKLFSGHFVRRPTQQKMLRYFRHRFLKRILDSYLSRWNANVLGSSQTRARLECGG